MKVLILGAGAVGSTLAMQLSQSGHEVSVLARGRRLAALVQYPCIVARHMFSNKQTRAPIKVVDSLDDSTRWDLVVVAVQAQQLESVMPDVMRATADKVLFMMNMVAELRQLRDRVGRDRFIVGLPALLGEVRDQELRYAVVPGWLRFLQITTIGALPDHTPPGLDRIQQALNEAGIATAIHPNMQDWLLTHAAFMMPIMVAGLMSDVDNSLNWRTSRMVARSILDNFKLLARTQHRITPWNIKFVSLLPQIGLALGVWGSFQFRVVRMAGQAHITHAFSEVRHLISALRQIDPDGRTVTLTELSHLVDGMDHKAA
jgi:2-dehydropantoate 2-reductase